MIISMSLCALRRKRDDLQKLKDAYNDANEAANLVDALDRVKFSIITPTLTRIEAYRKEAQARCDLKKELDLNKQSDDYKLFEILWADKQGSEIRKERAWDLVIYYKDLPDVGQTKFEKFFETCFEDYLKAHPNVSLAINNSKQIEKDKEFKEIAKKNQVIIDSQNGSNFKDYATLVRLVEDIEAELLNGKFLETKLNQTEQKIKDDPNEESLKELRDLTLAFVKFKIEKPELVKQRDEARELRDMAEGKLTTAQTKKRKIKKL